MFQPEEQQAYKPRVFPECINLDIPSPFQKQQQQKNKQDKESPSFLFKSF